MACRLSNGEISQVYAALELRFNATQAEQLYSNLIVPYQNGTLSEQSDFSRYMNGLKDQGLPLYENYSGVEELNEAYVLKFIDSWMQKQADDRILHFPGVKAEVEDGVETRSDITLDATETHLMMQGFSVNFFEALFAEGLNVFDIQDNNQIKPALDRAFAKTVGEFREKIQASLANYEAKKDLKSVSEKAKTQMVSDINRLFDIGTSLKEQPFVYYNYFVNKFLKEQGIEFTTDEFDAADIEFIEAALDPDNQGETEGINTKADTADNEMMKESFESDPQNNMPKNVKRLLFGIPEKDKSGKDIREDRFGLRVPVPFGTVFSKLAKELSNKGTNPQTMLEVLSNIPNPSFTTVLDRLQVNKFDIADVNFKDAEQFETDLLRFNLLNAFTQQFAKHQYNFQSLLIELHGKTYFSNGNTDRIEKIVRDEFTNVYNERLAGLYRKTTKDWNWAKLTDALKKAYQAKDYKTYLELLGVEFSNELIYQKGKNFVDRRTGEVTSLQNIVIDINTSLTDNGVYNGNEHMLMDIYNSTSKLIGVQLNKVINIEAAYSEKQINLGHLNEENKLIYDVNLNTFLTLLGNELNEMTEEEMAEKYPMLFSDTPSAFVENSQWRNLIKNGSKIEIGMLSGIDMTNGEGAGQTTKDISTADRFLQKLMSAANNKFAFIRAADRSNENYISIEGYTLKSYKDAQRIFEGYLKDELTAIYKLVEQGTGEDLQHYSKFNSETGEQEGNGIFFRVFSELNKETPEAQLAWLRSEIFPFMEKNSFEFTDLNIKETVNKKIKEITSNEVTYAEELGFLKKSEQLGKYVNADGLLKIPAEVYENEVIAKQYELNPATGESLAEDAAMGKTVVAIKILGLNNYIANVEQTKMFVGDPAQFKNNDDFFKRMSMMNSTKEVSLTDDRTNEFLKNMQFGLEEKYGFKYSEDLDLTEGKIRSITIADQADEVNAETAEMLKGIFRESLLKQYANQGLSKEELETKINNKVESYMDAYMGMEMADAQAYVTLDEYRRLRIRAGQWIPSMERTYQRLVKGEPVDVNDIKALSVLKYQYTGPVNTQTSDTHQIGGRKFSFMPLIPQVLPKGSNLEKLNKQMLATGTGMAFMKSAAKFGHNRNTYSFYDNEGNFGINLDENSTYDMLDYKFMGDQLKINDKEKGAISQSTQFRKMIFTNFFENGEVTAQDKDLQQDLEKLAQLQADVVSEGWNQLVEELDLYNIISELDKDNPDLNKTVAAIKKRFFDKGVTANMSQAIDRIGEIGLMDIVPGKVKLEHTVMSMFRKAVMSKKRNGETMAQVSSQGFEVGQKAESFKWYRRNEKGAMMPMQIGIPLPKNLINYVINKYGTKEDIAKQRLSDAALAKFNEAVKEDEAKFEETGKVTTLTKVRRITGFRIPYQATSSGDVAHITEFFNPMFATGVIVPREMVAKTGSDFDIDKLNMYYNEYYVNKKGELELLPDSKHNQMNTIEQRITLHEENLAYLFTPIVDDKLQSIVKRQRAIRPKKGEIKKTSVEDSELIPVISNNLSKKYKVDKNILKYFTGENLLEDITEKEAKIYNKLKNKKDIQLYTELSSTLFSLHHNKNNADFDTQQQNKNKLKNIVKNLGDLAKKEEYIEKKKDIFSTQVQIEKANTFLSGKNGVGQVAVHVTSLPMVQKVKDVEGKPVLINAEVLQKFPTNIQFDIITNPKNGKSKFYASFGRQKDENGDNISEILSELLTAYVDIAKDPYIFDMNGIQPVANTMLMMLRTGISPDTVFDFINQPIIREFYRVKAKGQSFAFKANNNGYNQSNFSVKKEVVENMSQKILGNTNNKALLKYIAALNAGGKTRFEAEQALRELDFRPNTLETGLAESYSTEKDFVDQLAILEKFLDLQTTSGAVQSMIRTNSPDTKYFKDLSQGNYQVDEATQGDASFFPQVINNDLSRKNHPMLQATHNAKVDYIRTFNQMSIAHSNNFSTELAHIKALATQGVYNQVQADRIRQEVEYAFVSYLYGTSLNGNGQIQYGEIFESLLGDKTVVKDIKNLKSPLRAYLLPLITSPDKQNTADSIKVLSRRIKEGEADMITSELVKLKSENRELYSKIVELALIQSPMRLGQYNLLQFIPSETYFNTVQTVLNKVKTQMGDTMINMEDFARDFWLANPELIWNNYSENVKIVLEQNKQKKTKPRFQYRKMGTPRMEVSFNKVTPAHTKKEVERVAGIVIGEKMVEVPTRSTAIEDATIKAQVDKMFNLGTEEDPEIYGFGELNIVGIVKDQKEGVYYYIDGSSNELIRANGQGNKFKLYNYVKKNGEEASVKMINQFKDAVKKKEENCG